MGLTRITPPAVTPLSLAEVKPHLRVDFSDQDDIITMYLKGATDYIDGEWGFLGRALVTQTWRLTLDSFPSGYPYSNINYWGYNYFGAPASVNNNMAIKLPLPPLQSVISIKYDDVSGFEQTIDPGLYYVDTASEPGWVAPLSNGNWPQTLAAINAVRIDYVAGYAPDSSSPPDLAANVPFNIKAALALTVASWMENREGVVDTRMNVLPLGAETLLRRHKIDKSMA